ncbi:uncharacterized protein LOC143533506 [Bidens hawaiensis]|uniref:uncharacterized protein LOC143533506 n=1 Tax=Bidens hawaiensis TaxID=980011 RepID=UPI00404A3596
MSSDESDSDTDTEFQQDMEAFKRALRCVNGDSELPKSPVDTAPGDDDNDDDDDDDDDDLELLHSLEQCFSVPANNDSSSVPLEDTLPSDDFETLRAIQRRFAQYDDSMKTSTESSAKRSEQVGAPNNIDLGKESSPNFFVTRINNGRGFPDCVDGRSTNQNLDIANNNANVSELDGGFQRSGRAFVEAIKKNRVCQKLLRDKLAKIQARMEENRKLRERVKIMKDFQTACRKRTGRALSQKKDARIQLISVPKNKKRNNDSKIKENSQAINQGPAENSHVVHYRDAVSKYPFSLTREPWSKEEKKNLLKGIKQQFQKMLMDNISFLSGEDADYSSYVSMVAQIKDHKITREDIKSFVKDVRWNELASMYFTGRSGPECESRWRNCEDPSINHGPWTVNEDKKLLHIVSKRGISNWIEIAMELNTNRTPFQCLSRFQRSLNASIIKAEWTSSEDNELRRAVAEHGESNWQNVASTLDGRTGTQCSNRWKKTLNPLRKKVGKWAPDEDKRLKIAVRLFGGKNYYKIAKFVPGRTQTQCRERWVNCLDPCLNMKEWTEEEDLKLKKALAEHEYCWSKIAACVPPRTDSQCRRRWKVLFPEEVRMLKVARTMKKAALISNFVDREGERPDLTIKDFVPLLQIESDHKDNEDETISNKKKQRTVKRSRRARKGSCTDEDDVAENYDDVDDVGPTSFDGDNLETTKRTLLKRRSRRAKKVTCTGKELKLIDEDDDMAENNGHVDNTNNDVGPTSFDGDNLETTKSRTVLKRRSRKAKKVTSTGKELKLIDEDDVAETNGHVENTNNDVGPTSFDGDNSKTKKRTVLKKRSSRAKKVTRTVKVHKSSDEDDVAESNGHVDITNNDEPTSFDEAETQKKTTGKPKGNERGVPKIRSRRARQVTHTEKVLRLMGAEDNDGDNNNNDNVEENRTLDGDDDCEIESRATGKRKRYGFSFFEMMTKLKEGEEQ